MKEKNINLEELSAIKIYQGNAITDARYEMTVIEKQIVYIMMAMIKKTDREEGNLNYIIRVKDIEQLTGKKITNYDILRQATRKIIGRVYEIKDTDPRTGKQVMIQTALISSAKYVTGTAEIQLGINEDIRPYLMEFAKGFTQYTLVKALSLKSFYAQRFYEFLSRYKDIGIWRITVDELKKKLKIEEKYAMFGMFRKKVLEVAQKELKEKTDISFTWEETKQSRRIHELTFHITFKGGTQKEIIFPELNDKLTRAKNTLTEQFHLAEWQVKLIFNQLSEKNIYKTIYQIREAQVNNQIKNIGAYTWTVFENIGVKKN